MGNMRFKVGDRVRIKSLDWYNENKSKRGFICFEYANFIPEMSRYCGEILTISQVVEKSKHYLVSECAFAWTDEMIEGLVEEETKPNKIEEAKTYWDSIKDAWICPEGYQFVDENGNVINATKIVLEKKKKEYPKTFKECQDYLGEDVAPMVEPVSKTHRRRLVHLMEILLTCRDAYWKIAGEEMGLGKPWEPDWENSEERRYCIVNINGEINLPEKMLTKWILKVTNKILVFPTEEMRDAFYENFKELIEQCKELL